MRGTDYSIFTRDGTEATSCHGASLMRAQRNDVKPRFTFTTTTNTIVNIRVKCPVTDKTFRTMFLGEKLPELEQLGPAGGRVLAENVLAEKRRRARRRSSGGHAIAGPVSHGDEKYRDPPSGSQGSLDQAAITRRMGQRRAPIGTVGSAIGRPGRAQVASPHWAQRTVASPLRPADADTSRSLPVLLLPPVNGNH